MGMPKKPEVREREVEASVVKRCPAGLPCSGAVGAGVFPVGEKRHPFCQRTPFAGRTDSKMWVGGGKNRLQRKAAHGYSCAAKLI